MDNLHSTSYNLFPDDTLMGKNLLPQREQILTSKSVISEPWNKVEIIPALFTPFHFMFCTMPKVSHDGATTVSVILLPYGNIYRLNKVWSPINFSFLFLY